VVHLLRQTAPFVEDDSEQSMHGTGPASNGGVSPGVEIPTPPDRRNFRVP
jgi:hypothetical protein